MAKRKFFRGDKEKYTLTEKDELGKLCKQYKEEYDDNISKKSKDVNFNTKMRKHTQKLPREGYIAKAVREYYPDLQPLKHNNPMLEKALKLGKRCYEQQIQNETEITAPPTKSKYRQPGGGRKLTIIGVREAVYDWFIDIRGTLKARLPVSLFKAKCALLYEQWLAQQPEPIPEEKRILFSNKWIRNWMREFNVSLRQPNKRFQIKQADRKERVFEYIKNVWTIRKFYLDTFGVDPPVINGDQMPLHRNESCSQKTLTFTGMDTFVKENYSLSRERVTAYTQVCSDPTVKLPLEFVFKGKGTHTKLRALDGVKYNWAPKGSYRLEQMLYTISNLPNRFNIFTPKNYAIYVLDDYSVHIMPEVKAALLQRGYIYVGIGGGVTGDIQINDTDFHAPLKAKYRQLEQKLMMEQLKSDPTKIPQPTRDHMMSMLKESFNTIDINVSDRFKALWVNSALNGSEDFLVSERIYALVGQELTTFREQLMETRTPRSFKEMLKLITMPKGVRRKQNKDDPAREEIPLDEGDELFDCDGEGIPVIEEDVDAESADEEVPVNENRDESVVERDDNAQDAPNVNTVVMLAELCNDDAELKNDAKFIDNLGQLIINAETSIRFLPHLNNLKKEYVTARRSIKKRMQIALLIPQVEMEEGGEEDRNAFDMFE